MSRSPRNAPTAADQAEQINPFDAPGSYRLNEDGSYTRLVPATAPPERIDGPVLPADSATAIAMALAAIGHEPPAFLGVDLGSGPDLTLTIEQPATDAGGEA